MKKSGDEVLNDLCHIINNSGLMGFVNGQLYKDGTMRPLNSTQEDVIMTFKTGVDGQVQDGVVTVNIYVPDIDNGSGGKSKNSKRTEEISRKIYELFDRNVIGEYFFRFGNMIQTFHEEEIGQHFVSIDLKFRRTVF